MLDDYTFFTSLTGATYGVAPRIIESHFIPEAGDVPASSEARASFIATLQFRTSPEGARSEDDILMLSLDLRDLGVPAYGIEGLLHVDITLFDDEMLQRLENLRCDRDAAAAGF